MNSNDIKRWGQSIGIALFIFSVLALYSYIPRGSFDLWMANKAFGWTAVILAGITLLIGPLLKRHLFFTKLMAIRRHLGLSAFLFALFHLIASLIQTERFEWFGWYIERWMAVTGGIIAIIVWSYMTYLSRNTKIQKMGADVWKRHLHLAGYVGFLAIFSHLTLLKFGLWNRWWNALTKNAPGFDHPQFPPASLFVFVIMLLIILYRIYIAVFRGKKENIITQTPPSNASQQPVSPPQVAQVNPTEKDQSSV